MSFFEFWWGGFNFRPGTYNVPPGSSAPSLKRPKAWRARSASFVLGNVYWVFNLEAVFCQKKSLKMFYLRMDGWDGWDGMGWMDGWMDGISKVSFNFLHTLWVYR